MTAPMDNSTWVATGFHGTASLKLETSQLPSPSPNQIVVKMAAWSLNFRDLGILQGMHVRMKLPVAPLEAPYIPVSDGAGVVVEVGSSVAKFQVGDRVMTVFKPSWETGYYKREYEPSNLSGKTVPGILSEHVVLDQQYWTWMPKNLTFLEASTLPVAGLTAWQSLFGVATYSPGPGQTVLVEGTGGVSMAALQFAKVAGMKIIAVTSSEEKAKILTNLGADHVLNRNTDPNWPEKILDLTGKEGVDFVVEVAGGRTMREALKLLKPSGMMAMVGFAGSLTAGSSDPDPTAMEIYLSSVTVRGIQTGSNEDLLRMVKAIEQNNVKPYVRNVFKFKDAPKAFECLEGRSFVGKVCISNE